MQKRAGWSRAAAVGMILIIVAAAALLLMLPQLKGESAGAGRASQLIEPPTLAEAELQAMDIPFRRLYDRTLGQLRAAPTDEAKWLAMGMTYEANGRADLALACYRQAAALKPEHARSHYHVALALQELGATDEARAAIEKAISLQRDYVPAHWRLGFWLLQDGRLDEARSRFSQAAALDPNDSVPVLGLARLHLLKGEATEAAALLESLLARPGGGGYADYTRRLLAAAHRALGRPEDEEIGPVPRGAPDFHDAWAAELDQFRRTFSSLHASAQQLAAAGQFDKSLLLYRQLLAMQPGQMQVSADHGRVLIEANRIDEGLAALTQALQLHPDYFMIHFNLAQGYAKKALMVADPAQRLAWQMRAVEELDRTLSLNPVMVQAAGLKGDLLAKCGRLEDAVDAARAAAKIEPGNPKWLYRAGSYQLDLQRWEEAAATFGEAAQMAPQYGEAWSALATALMRSGRVDEAEAALANAMKLRPNDPKTIAAQQELAVMRRKPRAP